MEPASPVAAASHDNPYPYYDRLLAGPALLFDAGLGLWVASRAAVIDEVMNNPLCQVRPLAEPVPKTIAGTSAGAVFARLMRMNEGPPHADARQVIGQALADVNLQALATRSAALASHFDLAGGVAITRFAFDAPTYVMADLLGFGRGQLVQVTAWMRDFVRCLSPLSTPEQLRAASMSAAALSEAFVRLAETEDDGLASLIRRRAVQVGWVDDDAITANLIGLLSQTHEATAGLIGNCIIAFLDKPELQEQLRASPQLAAAFVLDISRTDPPVQNTRRFVAQATSVAGVPLQPGDTILLLLGAAGRDEQGGRKNASFGHGRHACPGQAIALAIAASALGYLLTRPVPLTAAALGWTYAPSANGRLPQFFDLAPKGMP